MQTNLQQRIEGRTASIVAASHVGVDLTIGAVAGLLPSIRDDLDLSGGHVAIIATVLATVSSFGQPLAGRIIDRHGPRWPAVASATATALVLGAMPILPTFTALIGAAVLGGAGAAIYHPAAATLARSSVEGKNTTTALGLFAGGGTLGLAIGPVLATGAARPLGPLLPLLLALPGVLLAIALAATTGADRRRQRDGVQERPQPTSLAESLRRTAPLIVAMSGVYLSSVTFSTAVPLWLADHRRSGAIGATLAVFSLAAAVGGIAGGRLTTRTGRPSTAVYPMLAAPLALLGLAHATPGSATWYLTIAAAGALSSTAIPVALDAAQGRLSGSVASASGLLMGLPIGVASATYLGLTTLIDPIEITHVAVIAGMTTAFAALVAHHALTPRYPTSTRRLPSCTCVSGSLAIATC
jgi:FSR family fosmidomycin resistance protein-like MFS transporter